MPFEAQYEPRNPITAYALATSRYMHEFGATRELRFLVDEGEVPPPADGARIGLEPTPGSGTAPPTGEGRMESTELVVPGAPS